MSDAFIINGLRTFIGHKNKAYKKFPAEDLVGEVLKELKQQNSSLGINAQMVIARNCTRGGAESASTCCGRACNRNHPIHLS